MRKRIIGVYKKRTHSGAVKGWRGKKYWAAYYLDMDTGKFGEFKIPGFKVMLYKALVQRATITYS